MQKLLITGGRGFLGTRAVRFFEMRSDQYELMVPSHEEMDITDEASVLAYMEQAKPDLVLHCAAESDTGKCEQDPVRGDKINRIGTINVVKAAKKVGVKAVCCSSDQVYFGSDWKQPHTEDECLTPGNEYGRGKYQAELESLVIDPTSVHLRLTWMFDHQVLADHHHGDLHTNLLDKKQTGEPLIYSATDHRGITDINEVVANLEKAFRLPGGSYNFGSETVDKNGAPLSTYDLFRNAFRKAGWNEEQVRKAEGTNFRNISIDCTKIKQYGIEFSDTETAITRLLETIA